MKIAGVIAEYNPFHNGHQYQLSRMRSCGAERIVAVMSGNFVQRGDVAIQDKFRRARTAVLCGADLVVELPAVFSMAPAERFAYGGIFLLAALGCVDTLSFGCEDDDITVLRRLADCLDAPETEKRIAECVRSGISHPAARERAVRALLGDADADRLRRPNNILGIEYIRACRRIGAEFDFLPIRRTGVAHDSTARTGRFMSASEIRRILCSGGPLPDDCLPAAACEMIQSGLQDGTVPARFSRLELPLLYALRRTDPAALALLPNISEGLEVKIHRSAQQATNLEDLLAGIKSKRYPLARIRRLLLYALLGFRCEDFSKKPPFIRVLAANQNGFDILRTAQKTACLPVVTKAADVHKLGPDAEQFFKLESRCDDIYALAAPKTQPGAANYTTGIQIVK